MYNWDISGSHQNAIDKATKRWKDSKEIFEKKLNGKTYDEWSKMSHKISEIRSKIKSYKSGSLTYQKLSFNYNELDITSFICKQKTED